MKLWLRYRHGESILFDREIDVSSQAEWQEAVADPALISSVLWPTPPLFPMDGPNYRRTSHPHERNYRDVPERNRSYGEACRRLAARLRAELGGARCLVYAPLRGALPIWKAIHHGAPDIVATVYYPVTSSFVFYPEHARIRNSKGRPASGRYANVLELKRLRPFLASYDRLIYVDEIVSGGMMRNHLREMLELGIDRDLPIVAVGLADRFGERSELARSKVDAWVASGRLHRFFWEGCQELITEDQRFLLGVHYVDYRLGPHAVPMLAKSLAFYPERTLFEESCLPSL